MFKDVMHTNNTKKIASHNNEMTECCLFIKNIVHNDSLGIFLNMLLYIFSIMIKI